MAKIMTPSCDIRLHWAECTLEISFSGTQIRVIKLPLLKYLFIGRTYLHFCLENEIRLLEVVIHSSFCLIAKSAMTRLISDIDFADLAA